MNTQTKKTTELQVGDVLVISKTPIKVKGIWGLSFSLDMYVTDEVRGTSFTTNRKMNLSPNAEFQVWTGKETDLFTIKNLLRQ